jgi:hypothetical protein
MALLGKYGTVSFFREWGLPTAVDQSRLIRGSRQNTLDVGDPALWSGDRVIVLCERGVPVVPLGSLYAPSPGGHSFYGDGRYDPGPRGVRRQATDRMYVSGRNTPFYDPLPLEKTIYAYIHKDEMDNITFYAEEDDAINGFGQSFMPISILDSGPVVVSPAPEGEYEQTLVDELLSSTTPYIFEHGESEVLGDQFLADDFLKLLADFLEDSSRVSGWKQVANLTSWAFETNVDVLDQNAIGQRFGDSAKGGLRGAGSFNAIMSVKDDNNFFSPHSMLRLMLITQVGAKAGARFVIADGRNAEEDCQARSRSIYYETSILLSSTNINTTVDEVISMSGEFVATGKIKIASSSGGEPKMG